MTTIDWIIVGFTLLMAFWGYAQGLIVGALSLVGFLGGAFLGSRLGPLLVKDGAHSPYAPLFALIGAFVIGGVLASVLEVLGFQLRRRLPARLGVLDGLGGAALIAAAGLVICWIAGSVALQTPGARGLRKDIQRSVILQALNDELPPSGPILNALARFDPFPQITGPAPGVAAPSPKTARDPQVRAAGRSTVKVQGTACGLGIEGSGWVARDGVVVTNAHVVAGESDTTVQPQGVGPAYAAHAIWFDAHNDIAILRVPGIAGKVTPLSMDVSAKPGTGARSSASRRTGRSTSSRRGSGRQAPSAPRTRTAAGRSAAGSHRCAASCARATRAAPSWTGTAASLATIFAASVGGGDRVGFGVPDSIVAGALAKASGAVGTGPCAH